MDLGQRVAVLETNQKSLADTLQATVAELKKITLTLAERRGAEHITLFIGGGLLTAVGWLIEHLTR
jgi:spore germination protein GerM